MCVQYLVLRNFGKTTPYGKILKILFQTFLPPHSSILLCSNVVKFVRREIGKIMRAKKILAASQTVATALIAPKNMPVQPQQLAQTVPDFIQIGSLSVEL